MPTKWAGTWGEWVAHRQAGNQSVQAYFESLAAMTDPIETDEAGNPIVTLEINPQSGLMQEPKEPPRWKQLFFWR